MLCLGAIFFGEILGLAEKLAKTIDGLLPAGVLLMATLLVIKIVWVVGFEHVCSASGRAARDPKASAEASSRRSREGAISDPARLLRAIARGHRGGLSGQSVRLLRCPVRYQPWFPRSASGIRFSRYRSTKARPWLVQDCPNCTEIRSIACSSAKGSCGD